jgi:hypothetical protein
MTYVFLLQPSSPVPAAPAAAAPVAQEQHWPTLGDSKEAPKKKKGTSTPPEQTAAAGPSSKVSMQESKRRRLCLVASNSWECGWELRGMLACN